MTVLARRREPLATTRELQRQHAALVVVEHVLLRLRRAEHLDDVVLHANGDPVLRGAAAEREYLKAKR